ncbi:hypothetical protein AC579_30 [Pseudocercospora musae]|uniref:Uncharacterized protein n=1 Tax=Pseudocercospora musae TaxID=113226 RepID=A0A139GWP8_9PEZI|nr:hypothetical protein AC579_30 [Pseudocercospora musae]
MLTEIYIAILDLQEEFVAMPYTRACHCNDGKTDLVTVTATTNAAVDLVKRIEDSIVQAAPSFFTQESYWTFMELLYVDKAQQEGYSLDEHFTWTKLLEISSFDDLLCVPTESSTAAVHTQYKFKNRLPLTCPGRKICVRYSARFTGAARVQTDGSGI